MVQGHRGSKKFYDNKYYASYDKNGGANTEVMYKIC